jgi:hypothetical protein
MALHAVHGTCFTHPFSAFTAHHVFKKVHIMLASNLKSLMHKRTQFKVALKRNSKTHSFYYVEEF